VGLIAPDGEGGVSAPGLYFFSCSDGMLRSPGMV